MLKKRNIALCGAAVLVLSLAGCGQQSSQSGYIGVDAAKAIALEAAGVSETDASFTSTALDERDGTDYYDVDFTAGELEYGYDIDAMTGLIIGEENGRAEANAAAAESSPETTETNNTSTDAQTANDGNSISSSTDTSSTAGRAGNASTLITEEEARGIALDHAGHSEKDVTFLKSKLDRDDGRQVYDIEFYTDSMKEYDYEIDASSGEIVSYDYDIEGHTAATTDGTAITADEAKAIALAQVSGATASDIYEFETDYDDGQLEYEGKIIYNGMEYEFTIDGYSGSIREWDAERYH